MEEQKSSTKFDFRLPKDLKERMQEYATKRGLSLGALTVSLYVQLLKEDEQDTEAPQL